MNASRPPPPPDPVAREEARADVLFASRLVARAAVEHSPDLTAAEITALLDLSAKLAEVIP